MTSLDGICPSLYSLSILSRSNNQLTECFSFRSCKNYCTMSPFFLPLFSWFRLQFLKNLSACLIIYSSLSGIGNGLDIPICPSCEGILLISHLAPNVVMICNLFEFNTSCFETAFRRFTFFFLVILSSTIG